jgi:hypothetical protein
MQLYPNEQGQLCRRLEPFAMQPQMAELPMQLLFISQRSVYLSLQD